MTPDRDTSVLECKMLVFCDALDIDALLVDVEATASLWGERLKVSCSL